MNYPLTYPAGWRRMVAWLLLLLLPVYAFGSGSLSLKPKAESADNVIKAVSIDVYTYEENQALTPQSGPDTSTEARPVLSPCVPADGFPLARFACYTHIAKKTNYHASWRGVKTPLQLFLCVLLI